MRRGDLIADCFEIVRLAGSGGMGRVYETRDHLASSVVALKVLRDSGPCTQKQEENGVVLA